MFASSFKSFSQLSPWTDGMVAATASLGFALAPAHRMIDGIHHHATHMWSAPLPASASRFATRNIHVIDISNLADGGETVFVNSSNLAGRHFHQRVTGFDVG